MQFINTARECGNYRDVSPLKAAQHDSICNLTFCVALNLSRRQIQCCFI